MLGERQRVKAGIDGHGALVQALGVCRDGPGRITRGRWRRPALAMIGTRVCERLEEFDFHPPDNS